MKKYLLFLKAVIILSLVIFSLIVTYFYFYLYPRYTWESIELSVNRFITIINFMIFFYILLVLINFNTYNRIFGITITIGILTWIGIYLLEFFKIKPDFWVWSGVRDFAALISLSILAPGLTLNIIKFIKNNSNKNRKRKVFRENHVHEGFVGILFFIFGVSLLIVRYLLMEYEVFRKRLRIFLALDMILMYLFLFSGSFLIFRDRRDIVRLKFIEKRDISKDIHNSSVFSPITRDSVHFFTPPRIIYYPFGILINSFSVNFLIHSTDLLSVKIFGLSEETIVLIGFFLGIVAGFMIGLDWYRLFAKLYPELYNEIEEILNEFEATKVL